MDYPIRYIQHGQFIMNSSSSHSSLAGPVGGMKTKTMHRSRSESPKRHQQHHHHHSSHQTQQSQMMFTVSGKTNIQTQRALSQKNRTFQFACVCGHRTTETPTRFLLYDGDTLNVFISSEEVIGQDRQVHY